MDRRGINGIRGIDVGRMRIMDNADRDDERGRMGVMNGDNEEDG